MVCVANAAAATTVGNNCQANAGLPNTTLVQISKAPGDPLPLAVPSAGVITSWTVNLIPVGSSTYPQTLKVLRATAAPKTFQVVGESEPGSVGSGVNVFAARIPVKAGDRLGLYGLADALYCSTTSTADVMGTFAGNALINSSPAFAALEKAQVGVSATVEPDVDGDGFGDETQDKCPRSAKLQTECPPLALASYGIASRNSSLILVASSISAPITVSATVTVPGKSKNGKKGKAKTLKLSGPTQTVAPGQLGRFVLAYSVPLKAELNALSPKQSLSLRVTTSGADATGLVGTSSTSLRLKGQAKGK